MRVHGAEPESAGFAFGHERAVAALRLGLTLDAAGYNIYVSGVQGTGRTSLVTKLLEEITPKARRELSDLLYVHSFADASRPRLLRLPAGEGRRLERMMAELVASARASIASLVDAESYRAVRDRIMSKYRERRAGAFEAFSRRLAEEGLGLVTVEDGGASTPEIFALADGQAYPIHVLRNDPEAGKTYAAARGIDLAALPPALDALEEKRKERDTELAQILRQDRRSARALERELTNHETRTASKVLDDLFGEVRAAFPDPNVREWLDEAEKHMLEDLDPLKPLEPSEDDESSARSKRIDRLRREEELRIYGVNVILDNAGRTTPPVIVEANPTFTNLFGAIERDLEHEGVGRADFLSIRAGSLLRADQGYLMVHARDVLLEPGVWRPFIRALRSRQLEIQPQESGLQLVPTAMKPEPIPIDVKVILIGDEGIYELLTDMEDEFSRVFKVKAEFEVWAENDPDNLTRFLAVLARIRDREKLLPFDPNAAAAIVEVAARRAGSKRQLTTRFGELADLMREASYFAKGKSSVGAEDVRAALKAREQRHDRASRHIDRMLIDGVLLIDTQGAQVGQINALAIYGVEPTEFGRPSRITASVGAGRGGIVNIEREARLSGPSHDKGVMILSGWLRSRYGRDRPLALTASIAFEQSYGGVDGDSASLAELFALLSAISGIPIRQDMAITGSVSQGGEAQPIDGVNEKIEGFFRLCALRGLTGTQGVIIPASCVDALMLEPEVVAAAEAGRFHVFAIRRVDDALPLLFGVPADEVHARTEARLAELAGRTASSDEREDRSSIPAAPPSRAPSPPEEPHIPSPGR